MAFLAVVGLVTGATAVNLAQDAGTALRDTGIAVIVVLIPLAVALALAKMALPWAKRFLMIGHGDKRRRLGGKATDREEETDYW